MAADTPIQPVVKMACLMEEGVIDVDDERHHLCTIDSCLAILMSLASDSCLAILMSLASYSCLAILMSLASDSCLDILMYLA